jgi:hypothetical protein
LRTAPKDKDGDRDRRGTGLVGPDGRDNKPAEAGPGLFRKLEGTIGGLEPGNGQGFCKSRGKSQKRQQGGKKKESRGKGSPPAARGHRILR